MIDSDAFGNDFDEETDRSRPPKRQAAGPGRDRKLKARRASRRKAGGAAANAGIHRRGSKRRSN